MQDFKRAKPVHTEFTRIRNLKGNTRRTFSARMINHVSICSVHCANILGISIYCSVPCFLRRRQRDCSPRMRANSIEYIIRVRVRSSWCRALSQLVVHTIEKRAELREIATTKVAGAASDDILENIVRGIARFDRSSSFDHRLQAPALRSFVHARPHGILTRSRTNDEHSGACVPIRYAVPPTSMAAIDSLCVDWQRPGNIAFQRFSLSRVNIRTALYRNLRQIEDINKRAIAERVPAM